MNDERLVADLSEHAAAEALETLFRITETAPTHLTGPVLVKAFAKVTASIGSTLAELPAARQQYFLALKEEIQKEIASHG